MRVKKLSKIDAQIIKMLLKDARTPLSDIAKICKVSTTLIHKRFHDLKKSGVISGTRLILSTKLRFTLIMELAIEKNTELEVIATLNNIPNCLVVFHVVGEYDIHSVFTVKSIGEIQEIRDILAKDGSIKNIKMIISGNYFTLLPENLSIEHLGE
jgi:DNA-binding Lrp family transcriptional regulator